MTLSNCVLILSQLLEAIGVLTKDEHKKAAANSRESAYQDAATESLESAAENLAAQVGDSPEESDPAAAATAEAQNVSAKPSSLIGLAVFKVIHL